MNGDDFSKWWARNHPWDWWASERGTPLDHSDRLRVWSLCQDAFKRNERHRNSTKLAQSSETDSPSVSK